MMGPLELLKGLKVAVLDAANYERLESAFALLEKNWNEVKKNNELLKERDEILTAKVADLVTENEKLRQTCDV